MLRDALKILLFAAALAAVLLTVRLRLVEPDEMAAACAASAAPWYCTVRTLAIQGFVHHGYGYVSVAAALFAWLGSSRAGAVLALAAGMAGVVLYDFELAAPGLMAGALLLMRRAGGTRGAEQQAAAQ